MLQEFLLILTQFGGGPGDPANNVVRFLLAAFFWGILLLVSYRMWLSTQDRRHLFFSISAAVGISRELFMFTAEYGSHRGFISFANIFRYYPPLEHACATLSILLMGYAFLRFYFNFEKIARLFLIGSLFVTFLTYSIVAPLWISYLEATARASATGHSYMGAHFHSFPGDLAFRVIGSMVTLLILAAFLYAQNRSIKVPWLAFLAFIFFFLDDALQAVNDLCNDRYTPIFAPLRHCLHIAGIAQLVGVYWWEITRQFNEKKHLLQAVLDAIPDQIFYKNIDGIYEGCNQTFAEFFFGRPKNQIIGYSDKNLVSDASIVERHICSDQTIIATNTSHSDELPYTLSDGKQAVLETIKTPFHDSYGNVVGLIGVSRDISERRKLEEQLRHSQKMEAVGQLAGGVAHDFNNILTAIIGYAALMELEIGPQHHQSYHLTQIQHASERAAKLVQNLMSFSRRETLSASSYDLNSIVGNLKDFLHRLITEDINFSAICCESVLNVHVDKGQIEQVLTNLVANARDAMPTGGELNVSTQLSALDESFIRMHGYGTPGSYALVTMTDNGHGMDEKTCKRIFDPFFTTKEVGKGTGLGLAIVYGIIKQHGGYITVSSTQGAGTTFRIYLPITIPESDECKQVTTATVIEKGSETILVVEDDPVVRDVVETTLRKFNYLVITAVDGLDAVNQFSSNNSSVDLVLMDIIMPRMNGKQAAEEIKKIRPGIRILFTSGHTADIIHRRGELEEGEEMMLKPVKPIEMLRTIRRMLDS